MRASLAVWWPRIHLSMQGAQIPFLAQEDPTCRRTVKPAHTTTRLLPCHACLTTSDPVDCRPPGSSARAFSRQESWSGSPFPSPGDLPDPGIEPTSLMSPALAGGFFTTGATWETTQSKPHRDTTSRPLRRRLPTHS